MRPIRQQNEETPINLPSKAPLSKADAALQRRFVRIGVALLIAGLGAAALINRFAGPDPVDPSAAFVVEGGQTFPVPAGAFKRDDYAMETIGGKSNAVASEFREWFAGLWHGHKLAHTVGYLTLAGAAGCFGLAYLMNFPVPAEAGTGARGK